MTRSPGPTHQGTFQKYKTGAGEQHYAKMVRADTNNWGAAAPAKGTNIYLPCSLYTAVLMISESLYYDWKLNKNKHTEILCIFPFFFFFGWTTYKGRQLIL